MTAAAHKPIVAICGKGGVGKTVLTSLLSRVLIDAGVRPLLLIDADPVAGLSGAIGERATKTLGQVRAEIIAAARASGDAEREQLANQVDYLVLEALAERDDYGLLAMGRSYDKGCFCPVNKLLRSAIELVVEPFAAVLIDAEAGIEQINRKVTARVSTVVVVTDGSARSLETLQLIVELASTTAVGVVSNRGEPLEPALLPPGVTGLGVLPEDPELRAFDRAGRTLWELPADTPALGSARRIARALGFEQVRTTEGAGQA